MKHFDLTSFLIGVGGAVALTSAREHLRPVVVELAAAGIYFGKLGLGVLERQREHAEDLWAEIDERVRERAAGRARGAGGAGSAEEPRAPRQGNGAGRGMNGAGAHVQPRGQA